MVFKPQLQLEVANHYLYTVQTALNFTAGSFCCKITLIWLGTSVSVIVVGLICQVPKSDINYHAKEYNVKAYFDFKKKEITSPHTSQLS